MPALESLIGHRDSVQRDEKLEGVYRQLQGLPHEYLAVLDGRKPVGVTSRSRIGFMLGARFGFALNSRLPVTQALTAAMIAYPVNAPLLPLLQEALSRSGDDFHTDVVLHDPRGDFLGMVPVFRLAQVQTDLLAAQLHWVKEQQRIVRETNVDLFRKIGELRQSQGLYRSVFENTTTGFALLGTDGYCEAANARFLQVLALEPDRLRRRPFISFIVEPHRAAFQRVLMPASDYGYAPRIAEVSLIGAGNRQRIARLCASWIAETGQWSLSLDDVTEERALQASAHAKEKRSLLESLVGGIAHELNNKLTPIAGFAGLLDGRLNPEEVTEFGRLIGQCASEAATIIQQLLNLSKPLRPQRSIFSLQQLVKDTLLILKFRLRESDVTASLDAPEPPIELLADPGQIKQVLINLCVNAIDAMSGRPERQLRLHLEEDDDLVLLHVSDTGCGIPREHIGRVFHPFFTTKGPQAGTGLGLSICSAIIEEHGGRIEVQSVVGHGSEFTVTLPCNLEHTSGAPSPAESDEKSCQERISSPVLIAEDEEVVARLVQEVLRKRFNCEVVRAADGAEALERCRQGGIGCVISDLRMPRMTGLEFYRRLRVEDPALARRFIFMSGNENAPEFRDHLAETGVRVLPKPFTGTDLIEALASLSEETMESGAR